MGLPDIVDRGLAEALTLGQAPATPVRHTFWLSLECRLHHRGDRVDVINRFASSPGSHLPQSVQPLLGETVAPQNDGFAMHRQLLGDGQIGLSLAVSENDSAAQRDLLGRAMRRDPLQELLLFRGSKLTGGGHSPGYSKTI